MHYLSVCAIFKNETRYLREWVEYHLLVGIDHFYLVSNDDDPIESQALLAPYINAGLVDFLHRPGGPFVSIQTDLYLELLLMCREHTHWTAFIDIDEFLLPVKERSLKKILKRYEDFAALVVNWACFGPGNVKEPPQLQTEAFTRRLSDAHPDSRIYKSIIQPMRVIGVHNPHAFIFNVGDVVVDESKAPITELGYRNTNNHFFGNDIRINHYRTRSQQEFDEKVSRWQGNDHPNFGSDSDIRKYWQTMVSADVEDHTIGRFIPALKDRLRQ